MEYCDGGDLFNRVSSEYALREDEARSYFIQIVCSVKALHENGVCHRDLKVSFFPFSFFFFKKKFYF